MNAYLSLDVLINVRDEKRLYAYYLEKYCTNRKQ